jgi:hypothetical protein
MRAARTTARRLMGLCFSRMEPICVSHENSPSTAQAYRPTMMVGPLLGSLLAERLALSAMF